MKEISEKIINVWIHGDEKALAEITTAIYPLVTDICARILGSSHRHDVDDVVQGVMLKILENRAKLKEPQKIKSFIYAVVKKHLHGLFSKN